jgi:hypothetical protein
MTLIIGIDPGKSGGVAWRKTTAQREYTDATKFPETEKDVANLFYELMNTERDCFAYLERVGATPQMGVTSAFTFGRGYGFLRGCLIGFGIPFEEVSAVKWQAEFGLRQGKKLAQGDSEKHNAIKGKAQQLFPHLQITHAKAAALLICEYGLRLQLPAVA